MPPRFDATTGNPAANASLMTNGEFSIQIDGTTSTSIEASSAGTFSCATPPSHSTPLRCSIGRTMPA